MINITIDQDKCIGCGACVNMCPRKILFLDETGKCDITDKNECDDLRGCMYACPVDAIKF